MIVLFILLIQISFISNFDFWRTKLNLVLILLIFFVLLLNFQPTILWGLFCGYILDYYSSLPFGVITLSLVISLIAVYVLFNNYFTNRSLLTLVILTASGTIFFHILILLFSYFVSIFGVIQWQFSVVNIWSIIMQIVFNVLVASVCYFIYTVVTNRIKRNFLVRGNL